MRAISAGRSRCGRLDRDRFLADLWKRYALCELLTSDTSFGEVTNGDVSERHAD
jgi:hypothetical protein